MMTYILKINFKISTIEELNPFLYLLSNISNNHHHTANFFSKIDRILESFKYNNQKFCSNSELLDIFYKNKRILLTLIELKILIIDELIVKRIIQYKYVESKYPHFFQPEIQPFINKNWFPKYNHKRSDGWILEITKEIPEHFYEQRIIGENDHFICELIRKDSIDDFIVYINKNNYQLNSEIKSSIYETNNFILKKEKNPTLIDFFSLQYFNCKKIGCITAQKNKTF